MNMLKDYVDKRLEICRACLLYKDSPNGPICDSSKYMSPDWKDWSYFQKPNWIRGCNCLLKNKTAGLNNKCVAGKW